MAKSTIGNIVGGLEVSEAPQPPTLGEPVLSFPQNWGTEGGFQQSREFAKYFASSISIGGLGAQIMPLFSNVKIWLMSVNVSLL